MSGRIALYWTTFRTLSEAAGPEGMEPRITIRRPTIEDAERISALLSELAEEFIFGEFTQEGREQLLANFDVSEMQKRLASDEYRFHVAEDGSVLAGVVATLGSSHLYYLFVATAYQRMGLARRLWDLARSESVRAGNVSGRFTVKASAYAVRAYERLGFRCSGPMTDVKGVRSQPMDWAGTT